MRYKIILIIILSLFLLPNISLAGDLKIGSVCKENADCESGDCEYSTKLDTSGNKISFCDCKEITRDFNPLSFIPGGDSPFDLVPSQTCAKQYNGKPEDWICVDGANTTWDLDYCLKKDFKTSADVMLPIPPKDITFGQSLTDLIFDSDAAYKANIEEINQILKEPRLKITIPGLEFTKREGVASLTTEGPRGVYLSIPFIGEYLTAIYKWFIVALGIFTTVRIIDGGFGWLFSGGAQDEIKKAQDKIKHAFIGLLIALSSYLLLYTINPELVQFKNLKILYVENIELNAELLGMSDTEFEDLGKPKPSTYTSSGGTSVTYPPGSIGGKATGFVIKSGKEAYQIASNLSMYYCDEPKNKSVRDTNFDGFLSGKGIAVDYSLFGSLDCNKGATSRPNNQIDRVILHHGYPEFPNAGGKKKALQTVVDWRQRAVQGEVKVASHFIVDRAGVIYPLISPEFYASHAPSQNKRGVGIDLQYDNTTHGVNDITTNFYTEAQYKSVAAIIEYLSQKFPKMENKDYNVMGHGECQFNRSDASNFEFEKLKTYIPGSDFNNSKHNRIFLSDTLKKLASPTLYTPYCEYVMSKDGTVPYKP